jgi:hypothetical protein
MSKNCLESTLDNILSIGFLFENWTIRFEKSDDSVFSENSYIYLFDLIFSIIFQLSPKLHFYSILSGAACQTMKKEELMLGLM